MKIRSLLLALVLCWPVVGAAHAEGWLLRTSDIIAIVAVVIALASAIYANRIARQANKIAIHEERLKIYKALLTHVKNLSAKGLTISSDDVWEFYDSATLAEFYFDHEHAEKMEKIFNDSLQLVEKYYDWEERKANKETAHTASIEEIHLLHRATRDSAFELAEEMRPALRVSKV